MKIDNDGYICRKAKDNGYEAYYINIDNSTIEIEFIESDNKITNTGKLTYHNYY